jgi:hypothetical protein
MMARFYAVIDAFDTVANEAIAEPRKARFPLAGMRPHYSEDESAFDTQSAVFPYSPLPITHSLSNAPFLLKARIKSA